MWTRRAVAIAILLTSTAIPALAQTSGGAGGGDLNTLTTGGSAGTSNAITAGGVGGVGTISGGIGGGGGGGGAGSSGGAGGVGTNVGAGAAAAGSGGATAGASGTNGDDSTLSCCGGAAGGGGGAHGEVLSATTADAGATGGNGGNGGSTTAFGDGGGGGGGAGGYGVVVNGSGLSYSNTGTVHGGAGGAGGALASGSLGVGGNGGGGGYGVFFTGSGTLNNSGTITGGNGGAGGGGDFGNAGANGNGGIGIIGSGITIINSGTITGGLDGDSVTRGDAIQFTGGTNSLTLQNGSTITGNVVAFSTSDTLALGGSTNASFDVSSIGPAAQYQGFGVFQKTGSSTWTLTNTTTSITNWTINAGALSISSNGNLGAAGGTLALDNGTTLAFTATGTYSHAITIAGDPTFDVASGQTVTYSAAITDGASAGTLEKTDSGTLILTGANTYTGGTTVSAGTLQVTGTGTLGATTGSVTVSGGTLDLGAGTQTQNGGVTLTGGAIQNGTLSSSGIFALQGGTVSAALAGTGSATVNTSGTVTLSGANTYTGGTTIAAGTLSISSDSNLGNGGVVAMDAGTTLVFTASGAYGHAVTIAGDPTFDVAAGQTVTYSGVIADGASAGTLEKTDSGALVLSGTNTYTGGTTIAAGTLSISSDGNLGTGGTVAMDAGTTLAFTATGSYSHAVTIAGDPTFDVAAGQTVTYNAVIADGGSAGSLEKTDSGTLVLTATNTYTGGTTIAAGTLSISSNGNLGTGGTVALEDGATLAITGTDTFDHPLTIAGTSTIAINSGQTGTWSGLIADGSRTGNLVVSGGTFAPTDASNSYSGATTVENGGTLDIDNAGELGNSASIHVDSSAVNFTGSAAAGNQTITETTNSVVDFNSSSSAGGATINPDHSGLFFTSNSTAGSATISGTDSASIAFSDNSTGGAAALNVDGTSSVDFSDGAGPAGDKKLGIGSISGAGAFYLGPDTVSVGGNGLSTTVSGVISDCGGGFDCSNPGGSGTLVKVGTGTLTLTGANTYSGGTVLSAGTIAIGNNSALGTGALAMDAGTTLAFTGGNFTITNPINVSGDPSFSPAAGTTQTIASVISDGGTPGTVELTGAGTLAFIAANTYSGGTTVSAGTLQISGSGTLGATSGSVTVSGGTLDLGATTQTQNGGVTLTSGTIQNGSLSSSGTFNLQSGTVSAVLAGSGALDKTTSGTVTLSGANSYSGGTTISSGTLAGTTTSLQGNITDNANVIFNQTSSGTYSGVISGSGILTQAGGGTLTLSGPNTYSGGTSVSAGTLAGTTTSLQGNITDNAAMIFNQASNGTYAGVISGGGAVSVTGGGDVTLTGTNTYTGTTTINGGILTVMGSLAGPVTVNGGKLAGTGTVGAVTVTSGTLAPGDAIGTMHVNGNVTLGTGTMYAVEVSPSAADETIATGAVSIGSNATLALTQDAGTYTAHDYTLISAASVSGTFTTVTGETFSGLNSTIQYSATGVDLILSEPPPPAPVTFLFGTYGQTPNQTAAGEAVTAGPATGALYTSLGRVVTNNTGAVPATLAQLSGDIHASLRGAMIEDGKIIRDTVINHAITSGNGIAMWGAGFGAYGTIDGDGNVADLHHNDSGVLMGADMPLMDGINVGLGAALTGQRIAIPSETASASGSTNHVIGYANWTDSEWVASLGWDYGWGANQVTRQITAFSETDTDHQSNRLSQVFGEVGYRVPSDIISLEPYLGLANVSVRTGAFTETGGVSALDGGAKSGSENYSTLGVRAALPDLSLLGVKMVPDFNLGWQHAFTRFLSTQTLVFASTGEGFAVAGVPLDSDAAAMQAGFDFLLAPDATLDIGYDGEVSGRVQDHAARAELRWKF